MSMHSAVAESTENMQHIIGKHINFHNLYKNYLIEMTYAAIHGGGSIPGNFPGFSPKVTGIFKLSQFIFMAKDMVL